MNKSIVARRRLAASSSNSSPLIESLESRRLLSVSLVHVNAVTPLKITAGNTGYDVIALRNPTATAVTENVTITLAPSLDGVTAAGAYTSPSFTETVTIPKHGAVRAKVPFIPPNTLAGGKYHTLATVQLGADTITAKAPGVYKLIIPPAPTTTPSLVGHYFGLITQHLGNIVHQLTFIWQPTSQTLSSLTGTFSVGAGQTTGTMNGTEDTAGGIQYTLVSDNINYTIKGKVTADGKTITGTFVGTLVNNVFPRMNGKFKITLQTT